MSAGPTKGRTAGLARISLRKYLLKRLLCLILPIVAIGMAVHWRIESRLLRALFDQGLEDKAKSLASLVTENTGRVELDFADEYMPEYAREEAPYFFQIWLPDGSTLERSVSLSGEDLPPNLGSLAEPASFSTRLASGREVYCVGVRFPIRLGTDPEINEATSVGIVLAADASLLNSTLAEGLVQVALTGLTSALGISLVVLLALRRGARLLERVAEEVVRVKPEALTASLEKRDVPEEIQPIVDSLHASLARISGFVLREQRFNADVAHELRTPVAELRAAADVALEWPDSDAAGRLSDDARAIALQMSTLIESLLELAQLESEGLAPDPELFDLAECVGLVLERASRAFEEDKDVEFHAPARFELRSVRTLWEVVARNLIENALEYSEAGGRVSVHLESIGDGALLRVSNRTTKLQAEQVERCTSRLWRNKREGRSERHFGLGLSLVEAACEKLGCDLTVELVGQEFVATVQANRPTRWDDD